MGGGTGGAVRSAAISGFSAIRSIPSRFNLAEQAPLLRRAGSSGLTAAPTPARVGEATGKSAICSPVHEGAGSCSILNQSLDADEWVVTGKDDAAVFDSSDTPVRLVFGPTPTLEEAREATSDLKDALEKICLCSSDSDGAIVLPGQSFENLVAGVSVPCQSAVAVSSVPVHVANAFSLLKESPKALDVVASLASDENVWHAVLRNEKVLDFFKADRAGALLEEADARLVQYALENFELHSTSDYDEGSCLAGYAKNIKLKVMAMVSYLSDFLWGAFEKSGGANTTGNNSFPDYLGIGSFFALAVLVILVVLFKRA